MELHLVDKNPIISNSKLKIVFMGLKLLLGMNSSSRHKLVAILADKSKILSIGFNNTKKTHPIATNTRMCCIHAEVAAINGCRDPYKADLYILRQRVIGTGLAKPCKSCMTLIRSVGIRRVFYTLDSKNPVLRIKMTQIY